MKFMSLLLLAVLFCASPAYAGVEDGYGALSETAQKKREQREARGTKARQERRELEEKLAARRKQLYACRNQAKRDNVAEADKEAYMKNCMQGF